MRNKPTQVEKYGKMVWCNVETDTDRKNECLCLNCFLMDACTAARKFNHTCKGRGIALMVTRCPDWSKK